VGGKDRCGDDTGVLLVADRRPVDDDPLLLFARPFDKADADRPARPAMNGIQDARIARSIIQMRKPRGIAAFRIREGSI
jgi:hypothetical protein